jgi:hypothetical protein
MVQTHKTTENIEFSKVTFIHGPVSTGKSTVARLIDYCLGGDLEWTPAIRQEFVAATLTLVLGEYECTIERSAEDGQSVRVSWSGPGGDMGSVNAPLQQQGAPILAPDVHTLSDLVYHLCGVTPIKVRRRRLDPDSPLIRLSIRDIWPYCYLDQTHLDSSFFRLEDPFKGRKSQDAMRFFTGLHSERLSELEASLAEATDDQRTKREAVHQIRRFMDQFDLGSEIEITERLRALDQGLVDATAQRTELQQTRLVDIHPTDNLRALLRELSQQVEDLQRARLDSEGVLIEQRALRAELVTTKIKAVRADEASRILNGAKFERCPECGTDILERDMNEGHCRLCGSSPVSKRGGSPLELEALRRDLNNRIDELTESIRRREEALERMARELDQTSQHKRHLDERLGSELSIYDSAFLGSVRGLDREIAALEERQISLQRLQRMPRAIDDLEEQAGALQGRIDRLRTELAEEREHLQAAEGNTTEIAERFMSIMLSVDFPGVERGDRVIIDPRNWRPVVVHGEQRWGYWDTGSGGKKTLFNVCYALAVHAVALERQMPLPTILVIDSPTKNISENENPELVHSLYAEIYRLAHRTEGDQLQFVLIDSDLVEPTEELEGFLERRMAGVPEAPSLIPYYSGP